MSVVVGDEAHCRALARRERVQRPQPIVVDVELGVRDRIPVRVVRRVAERGVDPCLELLRQRVLEPVGLRVHLVDGHAEGLREVLLEQPVVPDDLDRTPSPGRGERAPR